MRADHYCERRCRPQGKVLRPAGDLPDRTPAGPVHGPCGGGETARPLMPILQMCGRIQRRQVFVLRTHSHYSILQSRRAVQALSIEHVSHPARHRPTCLTAGCLTLVRGSVGSTNFKILMAIGIMMLVLAAVFLGSKLAKIKDMGLKCAPLLIWVVFVQTISQFIGFSLRWPDSLKKLFAWTDMFNIDVKAAISTHQPLKTTLLIHLSAHLFKRGVLVELPDHCPPADPMHALLILHACASSVSECSQH